MNDIDMEGVTDFIPIGGWNNSTTNSSTKFFAGSFEGNELEIRNLEINKQDKNYIGLFGKSSGAIHNLGIVSGSFTGSSYVGCLIGYNTSAVQNCHATTLVPNPAKENVKIMAPDLNNPATMTFFDIQGKILKMIHVVPIENGVEFVLNITGFSSGIYFVKVQNEHFQVIKKLIVQ